MACKEENLKIHIEENNVDVELKEEVIRIEFPDPDKIGPIGPTGKDAETNLVFMNENEDICSVVTDGTPKMVMQKFIIDGVVKYKMLIVEDE